MFQLIVNNFHIIGYNIVYILDKLRCDFSCLSVGKFGCFFPKIVVVCQMTEILLIIA